MTGARRGCGRSMSLDPSMKAMAEAKAVVDAMSDGAAVVPEWLSTQQAASYLGVHKAYLEYLRREGGGPKFSARADKLIRYSRRALHEWMAQTEVTRHSERED